MKMPMWRRLLLSITGIYSTFACIYFVALHSDFPFGTHTWLLPLHFLLWPLGGLVLAADNLMGAYHWTAFFWYADSVVLSVLVWALVTWPFTFFTGRAKTTGDARSTKASPMLWELLWLGSVIVVVVGVSAVVFHLYPPK